MRQRIGEALVTAMTISKFLAGIFIFLVVVGIWWSQIREIPESPIQVLWRLPVAIILSGITVFIMKLVYDLMIMPLAALTLWLLREADSV